MKSYMEGGAGAGGEEGNADEGSAEGEREATENGRGWVVSGEW